jgi:uncharacterized protein (TIGR03067 family)
MRTVVALMLLAAPLVAAPVPKSLKKAEPDEERILGRWVCEQAAYGPAEFTASHKNDVWTFAPPGEKSGQLTPTGTRYTLEYKILPAADGPRPMDLALSGNKYLGVYELKDDTLTIAFAGQRPASLEQAKGVFVFTFRRQPDTPAK